jgi:hypothetical protein
LFKTASIVLRFGCVANTWNDHRPLPIEASALRSGRAVLVRFVATCAGSIRQFTAWNDKIDIPTSLRFFSAILAAWRVVAGA